MNVTLISLVIAVIGIVLQLADAFPAHRETRNTIVVLSIGVFLGMGASVLAGAKYSITGNVDVKYAILLSLIAIAAIFGLLAVFTNDAARREVAMFSAIGSAVIFLIVGFSVGLSGAVDSQKQRYSTEEIMLLAAAAEQHQQYELAIERLNEARLRLEVGPAREAIEARIARLQGLRGGLTN